MQIYNSQIFLALNQSLARTVIESDEIEMDTIDTGAEDPSKLEAARKEAEKTKNLQTLFKGTKKPQSVFSIFFHQFSSAMSLPLALLRTFLHYPKILTNKSIPSIFKYFLLSADFQNVKKHPKQFQKIPQKNQKISKQFLKKFLCF